MLEAECERLKLRQKLIDGALQAGSVLRALSDEAIAVEYDRRELSLMAANLLRPIDGFDRAPPKLMFMGRPVDESGPYETIEACSAPGRCMNARELGTIYCALHRPPPRCAAGKCSSPRILNSDYCRRHAQERCDHAFVGGAVGVAARCTKCGANGPELSPTAFQAQAPKATFGSIRHVLGCQCSGCATR